MSRFKDIMFVEDLLEGKFKSYDRWLESPYHREQIADDDRDDEMYEAMRDEEVLKECKN